jgi:hypothetical protein
MLPCPPGVRLREANGSEDVEQLANKTQDSEPGLALLHANHGHVDHQGDSYECDQRVERVHVALLRKVGRGGRFPLYTRARVGVGNDSTAAARDLTHDHCRTDCDGSIIVCGDLHELPCLAARHGSSVSTDDHGQRSTFAAPLAPRAPSGPAPARLRDSRARPLHAPMIGHQPLDERDKRLTAQPASTDSIALLSTASKRLTMAPREVAAASGLRQGRSRVGAVSTMCGRSRRRGKALGTHRASGSRSSRDRPTGRSER